MWLIPNWNNANVHRGTQIQNSIRLITFSRISWQASLEYIDRMWCLSPQVRADYSWWLGGIEGGRIGGFQCGLLPIKPTLMFTEGLIWVMALKIIPSTIGPSCNAGSWSCIGLICLPICPCSQHARGFPFICLIVISQSNPEPEIWNVEMKYIYLEYFFPYW